MEEQNQLNFKLLFKYGAILALVSMVFFVIVYVIDLKFIVSFKGIAAMFLVSIGAAVWAIITYRKEVGGYLTFTNAFVSVLVMICISSLIGFGFNQLMYNVIDPELPQTLKDYTKEMTMEMLDRFDVPDDQVEEQMEKLEEQDNFSFGAQLKNTLITMIVFGGIMGLILGLIFKKTPKVEEL